MIKNVSRLETIVDGRVYHLYCEMESPLHDVEEALSNFSECVQQVKLSAAQEATKEYEIPDGNIPA